jgi:minor extracellular protease Epr
MKPVYLSCVLLVCVCAPVYAQLLDTQVLNTGLLDREIIDTRLDQTMRDIDDVAGQVTEQLESVVNPVADAVVDPLAKPVTDLLDAVPLDALADVLPILTRTGETAFVDVRVENGWRAVEREWLIMLDKSELTLLQTLHAEIIEQTGFAELGMALVRFRVPAEWDSRAALKQRLPVHLHEQLDRNHIYGAQAGKKTSSTDTALQLMSVCDDAVKIGMIDTAINTDHPAFINNTIIVRDFLGEKFDAPRAHGTAVAGLLVGRGESVQPLLPKAQLYAASVFYSRNQYAQGATMMDLVRALNWLVGENVSAINMSLAGPDNQILRSVIIRVAQQGIAVIAAAGNEGPAAPPMYPAAYADVIAVTAVDREQRIYRWANRGDYIDFAALGVSVTTARSDGGFGRETGTSIAAPVVSAFVACELAKQKNMPSTIIEGLAAKIIDLGESGRDPVFGFGLLDINHSAELKSLKSHAEGN